MFLENSIHENGKIETWFWVRPGGSFEPDIPPIRQDNAGENFCFYLEWGVAYITEPTVFSMTIILPLDYAVDNVQCSDSYSVTSEDGRAKVAVENVSLDMDLTRSG